MSEAEVHVSWCIWHEGVAPYFAIFVGGKWVDSIDIQGTKRKMLAKLQNKSVALRLVNGLSDNELLEVIELCRKKIPAERELDRHVLWVCDVEGWRNELKNYFAKSDYNQIIRIYKYKQDHNPNAKNLLCCFKYTEIIEYFRGILKMN